MDAMLREFVSHLMPWCVRELREDHQQLLRQWICSVAAVDITQELQHISDRAAAARLAFDELLAGTTDTGTDNDNEDD
jgi:hypothetical protein